MASITADQGTEMLRGGDFADCSIICSGYTFSVHKAIIVKKSKFFKTCVSGKFKESKLGSVELADEAPYAVAIMLVYIYCGMPQMTCGHARDTNRDVKDVWPSLGWLADEAEDYVEFTIQCTARVYKSADRLMIEDLHKHCQELLLSLGDPLGVAWSVPDESGNPDQRFHIHYSSS
ncbi:uncharacterized protein HMPREF1541_01414 [Cyphellophora europaea CBS 101466]|uniref:BTB domain-containing protein n=1 Tax=Cyphellophora europaea (strain CBS 101466) TaxID=1220924 RepID=W2SGU0_CYPE1|nr:uncharacterized protein HMPREF1541_01414 [Cyphellophora europaea CBS 101466]ETN47223.1 hypothetical protein HMPREF1541_01414 [Cyphellophora europaea CBS 101466]